LVWIAREHRGDSRFLSLMLPLLRCELRPTCAKGDRSSRGPVPFSYWKSIGVACIRFDMFAC
jgi:hypothetical protein